MIYYKKGKKNKDKNYIKGVVGTTMMGAGGSMALGAIGGVSAVHGQKGIAKATKFMPAMGSVYGVGMVVRATDKIYKHTKKNRKRR